MRWNHKIKVKHLLEDKADFTKEEIQDKTEAFWKCIKARKAVMHDFIDEFEEEFEPSSMNDVEEFDSLLCHLYDYCDYNSIWVE
jgi:hypothetical protein